MKKMKWWATAVWVLLCMVALLIWGTWGNATPEVTFLAVESPSLPIGFDGFRIAQVSDLHNAQFGENNADLLAELERVAPDIIVITGDIVDSRNTNIEVALGFAGKAAAIAPTYFVSGNHERRLNDYDAFRMGLQAAGVTTLENEKLLLERGGDTVVLAGVQDAHFMTRELYGTNEQVMSTRVAQLLPQKEGFTILLAHRPELWQIYQQNGVDLVFAGHAHGGQFRFPWGGGIFAPDQGFFPAYTEGAHQLENMTMVVSRGLGNSLMPFRFNNRPELVVAELRCK